MGDALPVDHDEVGLLAQEGKGAEDTGYFPERKQAGDIGHAYGFFVDVALEYFHLRIG